MTKQEKWNEVRDFVDFIYKELGIKKRLPKLVPTSKTTQKKWTEIRDFVNFIYKELGIKKRFPKLVPADWERLIASMRETRNVLIFHNTSLFTKHAYYVLGTIIAYLDDYEVPSFFELEAEGENLLISAYKLRGI